MTRLWLGFSSFATTALLGILLAGLAAVSAFVPQGWFATQIAGLENTETIRALYAWGLTDVGRSPWLAAVVVLIVGNLMAVMARVALSARSDLEDDAILRAAPYRSQVQAKLPERAIERLRGLLTGLFGRPVSERVDGARVTLAFDTSPQARLSPLLTHLGLVVLLLGAILASRPPPRNQALVRALIEVRDSRSGSMGRFDLAQDETRTFFQWPDEYVIRSYTAQRNGLGPAIRIERANRQARRFSDFWVYLNAPPGFDRRHRQGQVEVVAKSMGLAPRPGAGLGSRAESVLLLIGLGLLGLGLLELSRPDGRLVVQAEGRQVRLGGVPRQAGDTRFEASFERWTLLARSVLEWTGRSRV